MKNHLIIIDQAGFSLSCIRYTCYCEECNFATLVRQPFMNDAVWNKKIEEFKMLHPFQEAITWEEFKKNDTRKTI